MMMMTIKPQKCAFFRADPPRGQAPPHQEDPQKRRLLPPCSHEEIALTIPR